MAKQPTKDTKNGASKAPNEKKTATKKPVIKKERKEAVIQPEPEQTHGVDPVVEVPPIPLPTLDKFLKESEGEYWKNEQTNFIQPNSDLSIPTETGITHTKEDLEGGLCRVTYSDGSSGLMSLEDYQKLPTIIPVPPKPVLKTKSKEEMDEEAHWMGLGQIDYYNKNIRKN